MNVCNTSLNLSCEELRQFLKQKEFQFSSRKVCLIKKRWVWSMKITLFSSQPWLFKLFKEDLEYNLPEGELNALCEHNRMFCVTEELAAPLAYPRAKLFV